MPIVDSDVLQALRRVQDPDLHRDIVTLGFVKDVQIDGTRVAATVELTTPACPVKDILKAECEEAILSLPGVDSVEITMTARVRPRATEQEDLIPTVKNCIAIASGKGGVGKSTVTVNLAVSLAQMGAKVGIMDADVYGPSIPLMFGADERPFSQDDKIVPIRRNGVSMMSLGLLLEEGQTVMWRGPMVAQTVRQLLADVMWGDLDYLLVDLPPGTGDAPMSLGQLVPLSGVVVVTTPHHVAANIAGKCIALFNRLNSPILGVVENMADYVCPTCGTVSQLFRGLSGEELARQYQVPYLGSIPLDPSISESGDRGEPSIVAFPDRPQALAFKAIAGKLAQQVSIMASRRESRPDPVQFQPSAN